MKGEAGFYKYHEIPQRFMLPNDLSDRSYDLNHPYYAEINLWLQI